MTPHYNTKFFVVFSSHYMFLSCFRGCECLSGPAFFSVGGFSYGEFVELVPYCGSTWWPYPWKEKLFCYPGRPPLFSEVTPL